MDTSELIIKKLIKNKVKTPESLSMAKREIAKKYKIPCASNIELLKAYHNLVKKQTPSAGSGQARSAGSGQALKKSEVLENLLRKRKVRSLSGVVVVSVLTKP